MLGCQLQLALVLLAEAVAGGEEVPAALLVHVPDVGLLAGVLRLVLVDEVHQEEPVEGEEWILEIETCLEVEIVQRQDAGSRNLSSVFYLMPVHVCVRISLVGSLELRAGTQNINHTK